MNSRNSTNPRNSIGSMVVLITAGGEEEAHNIAELLVNEKKAACVNIVPRMDSRFRWKGKIELAHESRSRPEHPCFLKSSSWSDRFIVTKCRKSSPYLSSTVAENTSSGWTVLASRGVSGRGMVRTGAMPTVASAKS